MRRRDDGFWGDKQSSWLLGSSAGPQDEPLLETRFCAFAGEGLMGGRPMRDDDPPGCNGGTHIAAAGFPPPFGENSCVRLFRDFSLVGVVGTCSFEASTSWYLMLLEFD